MRGWRRAMSYFGRLLGSLALVLVLPGIALAQESEAAWDAIRPQIFGERAIEDGSSVVELVAPKRAEDAALVPVDLKVRVITTPVALASARPSLFRRWIATQSS